MMQPTTHQAFGLALAHHQAGRLLEAERRYRQILASQPGHEGAWHYLGVIAHQQRQNDLAVELISKAITLNPNSPEMQNNLGLALKEAGQLDRAIASYQRAIALKPDYAIAWYNLGGALQSTGNLDGAIDAYQKAIALRPNYIEALNNLGNALRSKGRIEAAITTFDQAIAAKPDNEQAYCNLGNALKERGQFDEAVVAYRRAIALRTNFAEAHANLGIVLQILGKVDEALASYQRAVYANPDLGEAYKGLARGLRAKQQFEAALAAIDRAIELEPGNGDFHATKGLIFLDAERLDEGVVACRKAVGLAPDQAFSHRALSRAYDLTGDHQGAIGELNEALRVEPNSEGLAFELAALRGDGSVPSMPRAFVRALFDEYSNRFEEHLVKGLEYRVPEKLRMGVESLTDRKDLDVLDLGCGTGLCGLHLRPMARRLVGVDLSLEMLKRSAEKGIYDELVEGDVTEILLRRPAQWDVVIAGDVMIYVGDLSAILPAAAAALRPNGLFAFSLERYEGDGFFLHAHFRYSHSLEYVRELARRAGFLEALVTETIIRCESDTPVPGWIMLLRKDAGAPA